MIRRDSFESPSWKYFHEFTNKSAQVRAISEGFCNMHRTISCNGGLVENPASYNIVNNGSRLIPDGCPLPAARSTFSATSSRRSTINNHQAIMQVAGWNFDTQLEREIIGPISRPFRQIAISRLFRAGPFKFYALSSVAVADLPSNTRYYGIIHTSLTTR